MKPTFRNWRRKLERYKYGITIAERAYRTKRELPEGHPIRVEAQQLLEKEYAACFAQEDAFTRKYGWKSFSTFATLEDAANFANELCKAVGAKPLKGVRLCASNMEYAGAYYEVFTRIIYVRLQVSRITMIHEVAHHIADTERFFPCREAHGERFLEAERRLFDCLLEK
jgi:hypothetical protein